MALWVPSLVVSLRHFDLLMDRDQTRESLKGLALVWLWVTLAIRNLAYRESFKDLADQHGISHTPMRARTLKGKQKLESMLRDHRGLVA